MPFDPIRDFMPITLISRSVNILVVHPSLPVKNVKELIALAKAETEPAQLRRRRDWRPPPTSRR